MQPDGCEGDASDCSVVGEEDPGAAMDLTCSDAQAAVAHPAFVQAGFADRAVPSVATADAHSPLPVQVGSIHAVAHARLLRVGIAARLADVAALMSDAQLSLAVVCDLSGSVVGVIPDGVLLHWLGLGHQGIFEATAGDVMTREFTACGTTDSLSEVLAGMHERGLTHVPIVDTENRPRGVVYARDGLRALLAAGHFGDAQLQDRVMGTGYR